MEKKECKLWKVEMGKEHGYFYEFYLASSQKPMFIAETAMEKFRRKYSFFSASRPAQKLVPAFYIAKKQRATARETNEMHGFALHEVSSQHIVLSMENPEQKSLYEICLFSKKDRVFFKKKYVLAADKKNALDYAQKFKNEYQTHVSRAKKIDCYPILSIDNEKIILNAKIKPFKENIF